MANYFSFGLTSEHTTMHDQCYNLLGGISGLPFERVPIYEYTNKTLRLAAMLNEYRCIPRSIRTEFEYAAI